MATTQDAFLAAQSAFMAMMQAGYFPQPQKSQQTQPEPPMHMFPPTFQPPHTFSMFPPMQTWINSMTTSGESISLNEEEYIIKALSKFLRQGRNHNEALNSLDGVSSCFSRSHQFLTFVVQQSFSSSLEGTLSYTFEAS